MTIFRAGLFDGDVAIVTGGGTGIGLTVANELVALGADVAICGRRVEPLEAAANEIGAVRSGARVHYATCDIREYEAVQAFVECVR